MDEVKEVPFLSFKNFDRAKFIPRTKEVFINDENGNPAKIIVRNLTANELILTKNATEYLKTKKEIIEALTDSEKIQHAIKTLLGVDKDSLGNLEPCKNFVQMLAIAEYGIVEPEFNYPDLVKYAEHRAADFIVIAETIRGLTLEGSEKKP